MIDFVEHPGAERFSSAQKIGTLLRKSLQEDKSFHFFSPDETTSNKMAAVFEASERAWNLPRETWDLPESESGRVIEMLSENVLFSVMTGHIMNGEKAMMASYESFLPVVTSQVLQQIKFFKQSDATSWRPKYPAINLLSTSTCWRQDHNGFTHQSPALISSLLDVPGNYVNCLFPVDDVAAEAAYDFMDKSTNVVNLTTFNKTLEPRWIDSRHADFQYKNGGASIFGFASDDVPDFIFAGAGDIVSREALSAMKILRADMPGIKMRFVGINSLTHGAIGTTEAKLAQEVFDVYFTTNKPIILAFHGYADTLLSIVRNYTNRQNIFAHGFEEVGSTTTPFEMLCKNHSSRYDFAIDVAKLCGRDDLVQKYQQAIQANHDYAIAHGLDQIQI